MRLFVLFVSFLLCKFELTQGFYLSRVNACRSLRTLIKDPLCSDEYFEDGVKGWSIVTLSANDENDDDDDQPEGLGQQFKEWQQLYTSASQSTRMEQARSAQLRRWEAVIEAAETDQDDIVEAGAGRSSPNITLVCC